MRRALGVAVSVVAAGVFALGVPVLGCSHDARPVAQPAEPPPLPPASGTPIGYLIDAHELELSEDQSTQLKAIDDDLAGHLAAIEASQRQPDPTPAPPPGKESNRGRGLGFRAGGGTIDPTGSMGARQTVFPGATGASSSGGPGAAGTGTSGFPGATRTGNSGFADATGSGSAPPRQRDNPYLAGRATEDRDALIRGAVARALGLLSPVQRLVARRVLTERGIDPSTGGPLNPSSAPPGASGSDPAQGSER